MNTPTRDDLLGFVLGALEAEEHQRVADCLQAHPHLQFELQRIRANLAPLEWCQQPSGDFPFGLARRTCEIVSRESRQPACEVLRGPMSSDFSAGIHQPSPESLARAQFSRARRTQSVVMVCCAALLGAALGPMAMRFSQAVTAAPVSNGAIAAHRSKATKPTFSIPTRSTSQLEALDPNPLSQSLISFCSQSTGPIPLLESELLADRSKMLSGWRSCSDDSDVSIREIDIIGSLSQIGSRPLINIHSPSAFEFDLRPISN